MSTNQTNDSAKNTSENPKRMNHRKIIKQAVNNININNDTNTDDDNVTDHKEE